MKIMQFIRNMIKRGYQSASLADNGQVSSGQATYLNKTAKYEMVFPYGVCANPPTDSLVLLFNVQGQEQNLAGIVNYPQKRFKGLSEGEVQIGNYLSGSSIKFSRDGSIIIDSKSEMNITVSGNANINISGDCNVSCNNFTIDGELKVSGDIVDNYQTNTKTIGDLRTTYNSHTHISNGPGNPTDGPDPTI